MRPTVLATAIGIFAVGAFLGSVGVGPVSAASPVTAAPITTTTSASVGAVRITTTAVNARGHATISSKALFVIAANTTVRVYRVALDSAHRAWFLVHVHSRPGWVAGWLTKAAPIRAVSLWHSAMASSFGIGDGLVGGHMACGGELTASVMAVANRTLPCGTQIRIRVGSATVLARVLDRGPYVEGRSFDLGPAVCRALRACNGVFSIEWQAT